VARFNLDLLASRFETQMDRLVSVLSAAHTGGDDNDLTVASEYCVIHLQDCWTRFVRDLIIRSSGGGVKRATGGTVPPGPLGYLHHRDAFDYLRSNWGKTRQKAKWEPDWHEVAHSFKAIDLLQPSNANDVKAALGASANPVSEVRPIRNFVAHRGEGSAAKVLALHPRGQWRQPRDIVTVVIPGTGGSLRFEEWCRRFSVVARSAVM
jgi:hypothetical protein